MLVVAKNRNVLSATLLQSYLQQHYCRSVLTHFRLNLLDILFFNDESLFQLLNFKIIIISKSFPIVLYQRHNFYIGITQNTRNYHGSQTLVDKSNFLFDLYINYAHTLEISLISHYSLLKI